MKKILILASNPKGDLRIDREIRDLKKAVERSSQQEQFDVEIQLAVSPKELQELLLEYKPYIVHFCGHGTGEKGLVFENEAGGEQLVSNQALSSLFKIFRDDVNCVLLNACHTEVQVDAILEHIQYAIGTSREILDEAAYWFAVGFYRGLGYGESIEQCYELGCNAIELQMSNVTLLPSVSERFRKLEVVDEGKSVAATEPLKIILKKNSLLLSSSEKNITPEFKTAINEESKRKRYNDTTRKSWDKFGKVEQAQPLTQQEYRQRKILLNKVKDFWIEGFLKPSLYADTAINLDLKNRPDAILRPFASLEELPVELDKSFEKLQQTDIYNQIGQGKTLLILGEPGSGKTIALLQLAQRIIERTERDLSQPIPVVFNLSSWAKKQQKIEEWLIEELSEKYQVSKFLSKSWIEQEKLILLLDGLDEVKAEHRNKCVFALNIFIATHGMTDIVVCSRIKDYETLTEKLQLSSAICLQPLSSRQVYGFLEKVGNSLAGLKTLLQQDAKLEKFAKTPLILNIMSLAYQGVPEEDLLLQLGATENYYQSLWNIYIEKMFKRKKGSAKYTKDKVQHWLSWLAKQMRQESRTVFLIEKMQPTWLNNRWEKVIYRFCCFILSFILGLTNVGFFGLATVLLTKWLVNQEQLNLKTEYIDFTKETISTYIVAFTLFYGLFCLIYYGLTFGILKSKLREIKLYEKTRIVFKELIINIFKNFKKNCLELFVGIICAALIFWLIPYLQCLAFKCSKNYILITKEIMIYGCGLACIFALDSGRINREIQHKTFPNQGIKNTFLNCFYVWLIGLLCFDFFYGFIASFLYNSRIEYNLIYGLYFGSVIGFIGLMKYGGSSLIEHFVLRGILCLNGGIPWIYDRFLDYASERLVLKKVGGGYVFYHRMLMEHLAQMEESKVPVPVISESVSYSVAKANPQTNVPSSNVNNFSNTAPQLSHPVHNFIVCSNCSHNNSTDGKFCTKCGRKLSDLS